MHEILAMEYLISLQSHDFALILEASPSQVADMRLQVYDCVLYLAQAINRLF